MVDTWRGIFRDGYILLEGGRVFCRGRVVLFEEATGRYLGESLLD